MSRQALPRTGLPSYPSVLSESLRSAPKVKAGEAARRPGQELLHPWARKVSLPKTLVLVPHQPTQIYQGRPTYPHTFPFRLSSVSPPALPASPMKSPLGMVSGPSFAHISTPSPWLSSRPSRGSPQRTGECQMAAGHGEQLCRKKTLGQGGKWGQKHSLGSFCIPGSRLGPGSIQS